VCAVDLDTLQTKMYGTRTFRYAHESSHDAQSSNSGIQLPPVVAADDDDLRVQMMAAFDAQREVADSDEQKAMVPGVVYEVRANTLFAAWDKHTKDTPVWDNIRCPAAFGRDPSADDAQFGSGADLRFKSVEKLVAPDQPYLSVEVAKPHLYALGNGVLTHNSIEDCYLLAALSVLSRDPRRIRDLFVVSEYNEYGIYGVCFFVDGEWRAVFVDDQFPVQADGQLAFARSKTKNEFWLCILEKAYARLYGGYPSIIGGLVHASFKDLTGGITDEVALDAPDSGAFDGRLWQRIYTFHQSGYLMGCGNPKPSSGNFQVVSGIVQGHAYAILHLMEIGDLKLIRLRNPWGEGEWEGDWGPASNKWTQKMRTLCNEPEGRERDGSFWMDFSSDFVQQFQRIYVCRVFENVVELDRSGKPLGGERAVTEAKAALKLRGDPQAHLPWLKASLSGEWRGPSAAGHVCWLKKYPDRKPELNPQFSLRLVESRPAVVFITLTQPTATGGAAYKFVSLLVLQKNGLRAHDVKKSELVAGNTKCRNAREICAELSLEPGKTYTVFVSTYNPGEEGAFTLAAYCKYPIALDTLGQNVAVS